MSTDELDEFLENLKLAMKKNPDLDAISILLYVTKRKNPSRHQDDDHYFERNTEPLWDINNSILKDALKHYNKQCCS